MAADGTSLEAEPIKDKKEIKVSALREGTVIDHLAPGSALRVLQILGITSGRTVTLGLNLESRKLGQKDLVKIESRELTQHEVNKIAILSPHATISIIRDFEVVEKIVPRIPEVLENMVRCGNPACISNVDHRVQTRFRVVRDQPLRVRCHYCERAFREEEIELL
ncbi:MAG: aspartate carbamoyltransferase regulatory subunit [Planctomycetota bacterium]